MFKIRIILAMMAFFSLLACKNDNTVNKSRATPEGIINPLNIQKGGEFTSVADIRASAKAMIDHRISNDPKALSFLTYAFWMPEFVYNKGSISGLDKYLGHWLDFKEDFSYDYGYYDLLLGTGRYHFRLDDNMMIMLDDDPDLEPKFWKAPYNGEIMALVGTHELGINNGMQIKMIPIDTKPAKK